MEISGVYIEKLTVQVCCTCAYWTGIRAREADGFVYTLTDVQGLCKEGGAGGETPPAVRLNAPGGRCCAWQPWLEIDEVA
jgi:hypothetical protein